MEVIKRTDEELPDGSVYTNKVMSNGEIRTRMVFTNGVSVSQTKAENWSAGLGDMPWQDAHYHGGLIEVYTNIEGISVYVWQEEGGSVLHSILEEPGETLVFKARVPHIVLLGPKARISTLLFGDPVGNSGRKNNDWWPVADDFIKSTVEVKLRLEKVLIDIF